MKPTDVSADPTVQQIIKDLLQRAELAEARADAETARADAETARADDNAVHVQALEKTVDALMNQIGSLTRRLANARGKPEQLALTLELRAVQRRLDELNHDKFGQSTERRPRPDAAEAKPKPPPKKQRGHGPNPQPKLARDPQVHLLDDADQVCPRCSPPRPLLPWSGKTVDSEEVTIVERTFKVTVHKRQVYRCGGCDHLDTALGPKRLIPGGRYSPEFAAAVAADKYRDHLPLNRQATRMSEAGLNVTRQTLWNQLEQLYVLLLPSYLALQERILASDVVYADETSWRYMQKGKTKRWWVWCTTDGQRVFFLLAPTRGVAAARQLLGNFDGILMADRYAVYETLERARSRNGGRQLLMRVGEDDPIELPTPDYQLAACWMHARRGFVRAARQGDAKADIALDLIGELYAVEEEARAEAAKSTDAEQRKAALLQARQRLRRDRSRPIIDKLRAWMDSLTLVPGLPLHAAVRWLDNGWEQLTRFLEDPKIGLDNGLAERVIRGAVLGRKTHAGSRSVDGTRVAAMLYSFVESCGLLGVDVRLYLGEAARRALDDRGSVFLPEDFAALVAQAEQAEGPALG